MAVTRHLKRYLYHGTGKRPTFIPPTLLPTGVYRANTSRCCWCALTAPLHPYQIWVFTSFWRYLSVALSSRSLTLDVIQQVWSFGSPDFPQTLRVRNHLANSLPFFILKQEGRRRKEEGRRKKEEGRGLTIDN
jgi:hypothetical protein